ncbi:MAG: DUF1761 domain-containing protein [Chitinophagales bacterium]
MQAPINMLAIFGASFVGLIIGFIWYHPKVFGNAWMKEAGVDPNTGKGMNMAVVFGLTWVLCFFLAFAIAPLSIHQMGFYSMLQGKDPAMADTFNSVMNVYGSNFRTFRHGALHGLLAGLFIAFPMVAINAMFERKSWKYIFINAGYWVVVLTIMSMILCHFRP